jgi:hypothetical protein
MGCPELNGLERQIEVCMSLLEESQWKVSARMVPGFFLFPIEENENTLANLSLEGESCEHSEKICGYRFFSFRHSFRSDGVRPSGTRRIPGKHQNPSRQTPQTTNRYVRDPKKEGHHTANGLQCKPAP